ncbi:hypothetical protein BGW36DRAFT_391783 [Talaromyces proteolyticus]|uniref:Uncharacterized protein n=1 Tax=Talaromyces proteolyticus TaxID=1131652 RepID=A0AAD4KDG9_9EURO|nr:uncharacterized protein BGW36DRAFT_391783 [Talaromyces proteolyticus]KAH8689110.1 hypothetical protein BGW36DRAFT_391783 [Talaromyces proteolyticus]
MAKMIRTNEHSINPHFKPTLNHFSRRLAVLISITTALPHPDAPKSILEYHLLSNQLLDDLARHYHQVWPPVPETFEYPKVIPAWVGTDFEQSIDIATKRRRFGRFIGLQGCESPVQSSFGILGYSQEDSNGQGGNFDVAGKMEREWQEALRRAMMENDSDFLLQPKGGGV